MGTKESVQFATFKSGAEDMPTICDECRKEEIANEMMHTYRLS